MARISLTGNITPAVWYKRILMPSGKPHSVAIDILAEICWWYRPKEVRDETGHLLALERKFDGEFLQKSPRQLAAKFGHSVKECQRALAHLEGLGLVERMCSTVDTGKCKLGNVCFIRLIPAAVEKITWDETRSKPGTNDDPLDTTVQTSGPKCPNITEISDSLTPKSPERGPDAFTGKKQSVPSSRRNVSGDNTVNPAATGRGTNWADAAASDPLSKKFLSILGLSKFPAEPRHHTARKYVSARRGGVLTEPAIRLVAATRSSLSRPKTVSALLEQFGELLDQARNLAEAELETVTEELSSNSGLSYCAASFRAAMQFVGSHSDPELILGGGMFPAHPRWALIVAYQEAGYKVDQWKEQLRPALISELTREPAVREFLNAMGLDVEHLVGIDIQALEEASKERIDVLQAQKTYWKSLLHASINGVETDFDE